MLSAGSPLVLTSCAWCSTAFPPNEAIERQPFGRRLAFDPSKGRLWVVCARCERWNLSPIESRWEAIEACERLWRETPQRASSGEIGLARTKEGTMLVRVGRPIPLEFAAWRYGDQFGKRRRRTWLVGAAAVAGAGALAAGAVAAGVTMVAVSPIFQVTYLLSVLGGERLLGRERPIADPAGGRVIPFGSPKLIAAPAHDGGWGIEVPYSERIDTEGRSTRSGWAGRYHTNDGQMEIGRLRLVGGAAMDVMARYAPRLNRAGAPDARVREAVAVIADAGGPDALPRYLAANRSRIATQQLQGDSGELRHLPIPIKLAIEMSSHEELERALLAGELAALEAQWRAAEEEAVIADALLLPEEVAARLQALRTAVHGGNAGGGG